MHTCMQCTIHYIATALFLPIRILSVSLERLDVSAEMEAAGAENPRDPATIAASPSTEMVLSLSSEMLGASAAMAVDGAEN